MSHENEAAAEPHVSGSRRELGSLFTEAVRRTPMRRLSAI